MAVGTSGNQYKNAPVVGVLMAELVEACEKGHDHDRDPVKFNMHYTKRECNIGFFSRLRENKDWKLITTLKVFILAISDKIQPIPIHLYKKGPKKIRALFG
jgi:hypothetical protein